MNEFVFYNTNDEAIILSDNIDIVKNIENNKYLVSNSPKIDALIYAPEINFYFKNSEDNVLEKAKTIDFLYEARALSFDMSEDIDYKKEIGKDVILVSDNNKNELKQKIIDAGFKVVLLNHEEIKFVYGEIGELSITVIRDNDEFEVDASFFLVENAQNYMLRQSGCLDIANLSDEDVIKYLTEKSPVYEYSTIFKYDSTICQYHERREEHCASCVEVCPTVAILKEDETKHLVFSHIDCIECGKCMAVCPSGSLDYAPIPRKIFHDIARMFENKKILIVSSKENFNDLNIKLPKDVVPLALDINTFLTETHFLTLLQESGANLLFYTKDELSDMNKESISIINQLYKIKFDEVGVYVAHNKNELQEQLNNLKFIENSLFQISEYAMAKREIFSKRVEHLVGNEDLGTIKTAQWKDGEWIRYGKVNINQDTCTLCLCCVGACNVGALYADKTDNSIKLNASVCTTCGYCVPSCPEKDTIEVITGEIELKPQYFSYQTLAKDTLFSCIECGKDFATTKSIMKIANMMGPKFLEDPIKAKTLYCCPDCKAKIMIQRQLNDQERELNEI